MRKMIFILSLLFFVFSTSPLFATSFSINNAFFGDNNFKHLTLGTIYTPIISLVYVAAGIIVLFSFLFAGFKILQGTPQSLDQGRTIIVYAFGGILLLVSVYWITDIIGASLGTNPNSGSTQRTPPPVVGTGGSIPPPEKTICEKFTCISTSDISLKLCHNADFSKTVCTNGLEPTLSCIPCYFP